MKQLELSGYGVAEMQWDEMRETDGGGWPWSLVTLPNILGAFVLEVVLNPKQTAESLNKGAQQADELMKKAYGK